MLCTLEETEAVPKWVAAERSGPMLRVVEDLLALGAKRLNSLEGRVEILYMKVEMHRRPMTLELAPVIRLRRRLRAGRLFE